ncbi:MAG: hypothetical protein QOF59_1621 [Actinomycetota bacterium]|nr:hypothetical protein [Actinomycetota bacterium]
MRRHVVPLLRNLAVGLALLIVAAAPAGAAPRIKAAANGQPAASASIGLRLVDVPLAEHDDPRAQVYIVDHVRPGTVIHRRIEVSDNSSSRVHVALYSAAATIGRDAFLGGAGHSRNELSSWTSVRPGASDVAANGRRTATVTVAVPRDAAPGERYCVVWAEARSTPVGGVGITQVSRVGIRVYLSVGSGGAPASNFVIESATAERAPDGRPVVRAVVHNTGGRALDLSGTLQLSNGPGGLRAGPFAARLGVTLGIGHTEPVTIALDPRLPAGPWDARITLRSGLLERTVTATITFSDARTSVRVIPQSNRPSVPVVAVAGIVVTLAAVAGLVVIPRSRRRRRARVTVLAPTGSIARRLATGVPSWRSTVVRPAGSDGKDLRRGARRLRPASLGVVDEVE